MKSIKMLFLVLAITFTNVLSANTKPIHAEPSGLTQEISTLLKNPKFRVAEDLIANVTFILNEDKEIVVLSVDTDSEITYTIVGGCESNPENGLISFNSPLAKQLLGKEEGDEFKAKLPGGVKEFEVLEVKYQEIVFDCN